MTPKKKSHLVKNLFYLGVTIFVVESLIMVTLSGSGFGQRLTMYPEAVLDSLLLLLLIFPVFHFLLFRPMLMQNRELALMVEQKAMILTATEDGILGLDQDGRTVFINPAAEKMLGWSGEELIGKDHHDLIHSSLLVNPLPDDQCPVRRCLSTGEIVRQAEEWFCKKDGGVFPAEISCAPMKDDGKINGVVLTFRDITERKKSEEKLKNLAYFDALTGLANRPLLQDRLSRLAVQAMRDKTLVAVMLFDLDDFKKINDLHGHAAGDAFLKEIGRRIRHVVRDTDTVARLGGDEFVWAGLVRGREEAALVAEKILRSFAKPILLVGTSFRVTASIGIALSDGHEQSIEGVVKSADFAMYQAKKHGKNAYFFSWEGGAGREPFSEKRVRAIGDERKPKYPKWQGKFREAGRRVADPVIKDRR